MKNRFGNGKLTRHCGARRSREFYDFSTFSRRQGTVNRQRDRIANEMHGAIHESKLKTTWMPAAERIYIRPIRRSILATGERLGIGADAARTDGMVGIRPIAVQILFRYVFANQEGVAETVFDIAEPLSVPLVGAREDAVAVVEPVAGSIDGAGIHPARVATDRRSS